MSENASSRRGRSKREVQAIMAVEGLEGPLHDLEALLDGMEEQKGVFDRDCRNFTAQQVSHSLWNIDNKGIALTNDVSLVC